MLYYNQKETKEVIKMKTITRAFTVIICVASILVSVWFMASWMDIASDNCSDNPTHSAYNAFVVMNNLAEIGD